MYDAQRIIPDQRGCKKPGGCVREMAWVTGDPTAMVAKGISMNYLEEIDYTRIEFGEWYDELPLWSAPFGLLLLDRVPIKSGLTILDVGAGTGFLTLELAQRCGPTSKVIAVDPWKAGMSRLRKKLEHLSLTNVVLLEQDAGAMDVPDSSV